MSSASSPTERSLIDDLSRFARTLNKTPTVEELNEYGPHSAGTYKSEFGSWNEALEAADLDLNRVHNVSSETLKEDIKRVAGVLGKAPSLNEMDRFGEYHSQTYSRKLGSYVRTLEELGLEVEPRQYNLSNEDPPTKKQATKNVRKLRKEGPLPSSKLPSRSFGVNDKRHGMASFSINTGLQGKSESVFYLFNNHHPEEVLRTFLETYPETLENRSVRGIIQDIGGYGQSWKKVARRVVHSKNSSEHLQ